MVKQAKRRRPRANAICAVDLFSGCGGLTLGLRKAGFKVLGAVEIDSLAVDTYRRNHPKVVVWHEDIRTLPATVLRSRLKLKAGQLDLLAGCPPCQGFSSLRTLNRSRRNRDPRNDLVLEFVRFARQLKPKFIMIENVPGLAASRRMGLLTRRLEALGYSWEYRILDAADFGVPQRRTRLILIASKTGVVEFARKEAPRPTVREAISRLKPAGRSGDALHDLPERRTEAVLKRIRSIPRDGGSRAQLGRQCQLMCHKRSDGFKDVYGRMSWDQPAPTITSGCVNPSKGRFLHPRWNRSITLREAAMLQGFPRGYAFSLTQGKIRAAELIGNAFPPEFVRRHARIVRRSIVVGREITCQK